MTGEKGAGGGNSGRSCGGQELKRILAAATAWLERSAEAINALNVFPVPDGDTGTNMLLTMRAALAEIANMPDHSVSAIAHAVAHGSLMGARGNSGVILSQLMRGFARILGGKEDTKIPHGDGIDQRAGDPVINLEEFLAPGVHDMFGGANVIVKEY